MDTPPATTAPSFVYHRIPTKVSRKDFNRNSPSTKSLSTFCLSYIPAFNGHS